MTTSQVVQIGREMIMTAMLLAMPTMLISLVVGLAVAVFQTITSIQEQTLSFAPRIMAVGFALVLTLPWSLKVLVGFTYQMLWHVAEAAR